MKKIKDINELEKVEEAKQEGHGVAAFFDLDGTLMPLPSLEHRLFRMLRYRREIPFSNYFLWLREALRLLPRGISAVTQANKMYLKGVHSFVESDVENRGDFPGHPGRRPSLSSPVPLFFEDGIERLVCHAMLGHATVIVSGTLAPFASVAARALEVELAARGFATKIRVCATELEASDGRWTGQILGEAMFGEAKARAVKKHAREMQLDLSRCWAYGDSGNDRWMLETVGRPTAVNPTRQLARIARKRDWAVLRWAQERSLTQRCKQHGAKHVQRMELPSNKSVLGRAEHCA